MSFKKKNNYNKYGIFSSTNSIIQHKASNKILFTNCNNTDRQKMDKVNLNSYFSKNVPNTCNKLSDKYLILGSEKNLLDKKNSKNVLFSQIKKLITEFENEENEKKKKEKKKKKKYLKSQSLKR